jgi:hypothetical protein
MVMKSEIPKNELIITSRIIKEGGIASSEVRKIFGVQNRIVLTKENFANIRHLLYAYMTAIRRGMYRGGFKWVSPIDVKPDKTEYLVTIIKDQ